MEEINAKIIKPKAKYWLNEVYGPAAFLIFLPILGIWQLGARFYVYAILGLIVGSLILFRGIRYGRKARLVLNNSGLQFQSLKQNFGFGWDEIKAVRVSDQTDDKFIYIYTDNQTAHIPYKFFDEEVVLASLKQVLPEETFNPTAHQNTDQYEDWEQENWKEFSVLEKPLKVFCHRFERWLGIISFGIGIALAVYFYSTEEFVGVICISTLFVGPGLYLLVASLAWLEATAQEITLRGLFRQKSLYWEDLSEIYVNTRQGITTLVSPDEKITVPKVSGWAGKDREQLYRLLNYKVEISDIEPQESRKVSWLGLAQETGCISVWG